MSEKVNDRGLLNQSSEDEQRLVSQVAAARFETAVFTSREDGIKITFLDDERKIIYAVFLDPEKAFLMLRALETLVKFTPHETPKESTS